MIRVRFREQVGHLTEANKLLPNDEKLLLRRARANTFRGNFDKAIADVIRVRKCCKALDFDLMIAYIQTEKTKARVDEMRIAQGAVGLSLINSS
mmetsp:Transcript_5756/g.23774  ORF Transcript_5756/g.23774 Transcript_5756/m.23774 type:complete len:94 (-) Transcript_5756:362-643(-)